MSNGWIPSGFLPAEPKESSTEKAGGARKKPGRRAAGVDTSMPQWYRVEAYRAARELDAAGWYLNLRLREWLRRGHQGNASFAAIVRGRLRSDPIYRPAPGNSDPIAFGAICHQLRGGSYDNFRRILNDERPKLDAVHLLRADELYYFERQLPAGVRNTGQEISTQPDPARRQRPDASFYDSIEALLPGDRRHVSPAVRLNLALPPDDLAEAVKRWAAKYQAELLRVAPNSIPLVAAIKRSKKDLSRLDSDCVLDRLDLELLRTDDDPEPTDAEIFRSLDTGKKAQRTLTATTDVWRDRLMNEFFLDAWLLPMVCAEHDAKQRAGER